MKILIGNDGYHALYYARLGIAKVLEFCGHNVIMWNIGSKPPHDVFDEFEPDIFLFQSYNLNKQIVEAILERPHLQCIMKAGDWSNYSDNIPSEYQILKANQKEINNVLKLREICGQPSFLEIYYHKDWISKTHENWIKNNVPVYSSMLAADVFEYTGGQRLPEFISDITFIGGYWEYKARVFNKYLVPICYNLNYRIKIFGGNRWPVHQYCGHISDSFVKHATSSATICPNLHEPHSQDFGFDMNERTFKLMSNQCFVISDYVEGLAKLFNVDELLITHSPEEFIYQIEYFLQHPEERIPYIQNGFKNVISNHTYFHRCAEMFYRLGFNLEAQNCMTKYQELIGKAT